MGTVGKCPDYRGVKHTFLGLPLYPVSSQLNVLVKYNNDLCGAKASKYFQQPL